MKLSICPLLLVASLVASQSVPAAVVLTAGGYTQDFDSLASATDGQNYNVVTSSNPLPAGWEILGDNSYMVDNGDRTTNLYYSYGTGTDSERAFGHRGLDGKVAGISFQNGTGQAITELYVMYWGEQWHRSVGNAADQWVFQYSTTATQLNHHSDFTTYAPLTLSSPNLTSLPSGAIALDGNASGNRVLLSDKITGLNIAPNATFWIRWQGVDKPQGGNQDGLAIDDLYVGIKPIPEPGTITGLGVIALLSCLRRRR